MKKQEKVDDFDEFKEYVDAETGECKRGVLMSPEEVLEHRKAQELKAKRAKYLKERTEFEEYINNNFGSFYFNNYADLWRSLTKENSALAFRFLYLCTYADYDGFLRINGNDSIYMKIQDFKNVFNMSTGMISKLKNELLDKNLIFNVDNKLQVNLDYYTRGKLSKEDKKLSVRTFDDGIRELYLKSKPTEHKKLGLMIPLLKYVNVHLNIICKNVNEEYAEYMNPLDMREICDVIGYDYEHANRLKEILTTTTVKGKPIIALMKHDNASFFVVNPALFYKGKNIEKLKALIDLFDVKKKS